MGGSGDVWRVWGVGAPPVNKILIFTFGFKSDRQVSKDVTRVDMIDLLWRTRMKVRGRSYNGAGGRATLKPN